MSRERVVGFDRALRRLRRALPFSWLSPPRSGLPGRDLKAAYIRHVARLVQEMPADEAMSAAVGGAFDGIGAIETALVRHYGLPADGYLIDVGCGSGRLAKPLSAYLSGSYLGLDLVPALLDHARRLVPQPGFRFQAVDHIGIPEADGRADMVVFFSVLTHLLHEQSFWYLQEATRVLKPGGRIVFSFLDFVEPAHWPAFAAAVASARVGADMHLNVFIARDWIPIWAEHLGLVVHDLRTGSEAVVPEGALGQALCVLEKPL
ncbi:class I SAM-dependent methyltransferase [uncultured Enterovirga sp.]|uniref:class I SAM-dependent methyltransferase n=1 Tax=uncultured Enterovirga sp. TaxID=2026352 RepID=UPI0035CAAFCB